MPASAVQTSTLVDIYLDELTTLTICFNVFQTHVHDVN